MIARLSCGCHLVEGEGLLVHFCTEHSPEYDSDKVLNTLLFLLKNSFGKWGMNHGNA